MATEILTLNFVLIIMACLIVIYLVVFTFAVACIYFRKKRIKGDKNILTQVHTPVNKVNTPAVTFHNQLAQLSKPKLSESPKNIFLPSITPGLSELQKSRKEKKIIPFGELNGRKEKLEFDDSVQQTKKSVEDPPDINMSTFGVDDYSFDFETLGSYKDREVVSNKVNIPFSIAGESSSRINMLESQPGRLKAVEERLRKQEMHQKYGYGAREEASFKENVGL